MIRIKDFFPRRRCRRKRGETTINVHTANATERGGETTKELRRGIYLPEPEWGGQWHFEKAISTSYGKTYLFNEKGLHRRINEDAVGAVERSGRTTLIVADGMGGHGRGEKASGMTIQYLIEEIKKGQYEISRLIREVKKKIALTLGKEAGTTIVTAQIKVNQLEIDWAGDSLAIVIRDNRVIFITKPDTKVQNLYESGRVTLSETRTHKESNAIFNAIGGGRLVCRHHSMELRPGDKVILCSDGLADILGLKVVPVIASSAYSFHHINLDIDYQTLAQQRGIQLLLRKVREAGNDMQRLARSLYSFSYQYFLDKPRGMDNIAIITYLHLLPIQEKGAGEVTSVEAEYEEEDTEPVPDPDEEEDTEPVPDPEIRSFGSYRIRTNNF